MSSGDESLVAISHSEMAHPLSQVVAQRCESPHTADGVISVCLVRDNEPEMDGFVSTIIQIPTADIQQIVDFVESIPFIIKKRDQLNCTLLLKKFR